MTLLILRLFLLDPLSCAAKYKELWKQYTTTVRYRIFPGIY